MTTAAVLTTQVEYCILGMVLSNTFDCSCIWNFHNYVLWGTTSNGMMYTCASNALMVHAHEPPKATILCHSWTWCPPWNRLMALVQDYRDFTGSSLDWGLTSVPVVAQSLHVRTAYEWDCSPLVAELNISIVSFPGICHFWYLITSSCRYCQWCNVSPLAGKQKAHRW